MSNRVKHTAGLAGQAGVVLVSRWQEFCRQRSVVLKHPETDAIHDLRVASRRLRAAVGLFEPFLPGKPVNRLSREIRSITRTLGRVRNVDEALLYCTNIPEPLPVLTSALGRARKREAVVAVRALKEFTCEGTDRMVRKAVAHLDAKAAKNGTKNSLQTYLSELSLKRFRQMHNLLAPAVTGENVAGRHRLRIAVKKWRYLLEALGQIGGADFGATLETLKGYQTVLGDLNDMVEFTELFRSLGLPPEEFAVIREALARDSARHFAAFVQMAAECPLQYIFHL